MRSNLPHVMILSDHPADGHSSLPGHGQVMNASKDCDVPSGAECSDLAVNEPESESFQDVLPNVDNKDAVRLLHELRKLAFVFLFFCSYGCPDLSNVRLLCLMICRS